jgi:hypothetical protein
VRLDFRHALLDILAHGLVHCNKHNKQRESESEKE